MKCRDARDRLLARRRSATLTDHLGGCTACADFARRSRATQRAFADHHARIRPDPAFAERVAAGLPTGPADVLGQAALKLLPATLAVLLVLAWFTARVGATATDPAAPAPTENVLSWVADEVGAP